MRRRFIEVYTKEEIFWRERAKCKWLKEGDANTIYFYRSVTMRHRSNNINRLTSDEGMVSGEENIRKHVTAHFNSLFSQRRCSRLRLRRGGWEESADLEELEREFMEMEAKKAMWELAADKAP